MYECVCALDVDIDCARGEYYLDFILRAINGNAKSTLCVSVFVHLVSVCVCECGSMRVYSTFEQELILHATVLWIFSTVCCAIFWLGGRERRRKKYWRHMHLLHVLFTYSHHVANLNIFCFTNFLHLSYSDNAIARVAVAVAIVVVFVISVDFDMFACVRYFINFHRNFRPMQCCWTFELFVDSLRRVQFFISFSALSYFTNRTTEILCWSLRAFLL